MKKIILGVLMLFAFSAWAQKNNIEEISFTVKGNCTMCKVRIEEALELKGVKTANWDIKSGICSVVFNNKKITTEMLHKAVAAAGHDTELIKANESIYKNLPDCCLYRDNYNPHVD